MSSNSNWSLLGFEPSNATVNGFLNSTRIWCNKPHVANRNLTGSTEMWSVQMNTTHTSDLNIIQFAMSMANTIVKNQLDLFPKNGALVDSVSDYIRRELISYLSRPATPNINQKVTDTDETKCEKQINLYVSLRCLIPKQIKKFGRTLELTIIDYENVEAVFIPLATEMSLIALCPEINTVGSDRIRRCDDLIYKLQLHKCNDSHKKMSKISLFVLESTLNVIHAPNGCNCSLTWLREILLKKLCRWSEEVKLNTEVSSLMLISVQRYSEVYQALKEKYGQHLVKIWTEKTDPQKFVYEDIGIASYLIVLWEDERRARGLLNKQSFVDLGCGNGLLVYLLTMEGHSGVGLDIRKRNIWDVLSPDANLKECTLTPSDSTLFPDYDWLIGNHSDELTPWIPVIAARSHYDCRYFVLPCCSWDFDRRFSAKGGGASQYQSYLDFVHALGQECGFVVQRDVLRIPSTKRTCLIGKTRTYTPENEVTVDERRTNYIKSRCTSAVNDQHESTHLTNNFDEDDMNHDHDSMNENLTNNTPMSLSSVVTVTSDTGLNPKAWAKGFSARPAVETPRNGVRVSRTVKDLVTTLTYERLIQSESSSFLQLPDGRKWNSGGLVALHVISAMFDSAVLLAMKNECGGLQTLLKNCPDVFIIREGSVGLRDWTAPDYVNYQQSRRKKRPLKSATDRYKTQLCFHFTHHPDSCPLTKDVCRFAHGVEDIRQESMNIDS